MTTGLLHQKASVSLSLRAISMSIDIVAVDNFADLQVDRHDVAVSANDKLLRSARRGSIHLCRRPSTEKKTQNVIYFHSFFFTAGRSITVDGIMAAKQLYLFLCVTQQTAARESTK